MTKVCNLLNIHSIIPLHQSVILLVVQLYENPIDVAHLNVTFLHAPRNGISACVFNNAFI